MLFKSEGFSLPEIRNKPKCSVPMAFSASMRCSKLTSLPGVSISSRISSANSLSLLPRSEAVSFMLVLEIAAGIVLGGIVLTLLAMWTDMI